MHQEGHLARADRSCVEAWPFQDVVDFHDLLDHPHRLRQRVINAMDQLLLD